MRHTKGEGLSTDSAATEITAFRSCPVPAEVRHDIQNRRLQYGFFVSHLRLAFFNRSAFLKSSGDAAQKLLTIVVSSTTRSITATATMTKVLYFSWYSLVRIPLAYSLVGRSDLAGS
jgi:hypothetical protein